MRRQTLIALLLALCTAASAQTATPADTLHQALADLRSATKGQNRFTYRDIRNQSLLDGHGRRTHSTARDYDVTWLGDKPYYKLIAEGGRELTGHARDAEENRYLNAVATRTKLVPTDTDIQNARAGVDLFRVIDIDYKLSVLRTETSPVGPVLVLQATPEASATPATEGSCHWRYTIWIALTPHMLQHYRADAPDDAIEGCSTSTAEEWFKELDGLPYAYHFESHITHVHNGKDQGTTVSEDNMTSFRHFHAVADDSAPVDAPSTPN
ncbi:MAG: hypothetical protein PW792_09210 [Acidobacteriaceae bacterium]|nr:hypothetical protein [Acidobacteriaceae bacterium]